MKFYDTYSVEEISDSTKLSERKFKLHIGETDTGEPIYANITATALRGLPTLVDNEFQDYPNCGYTLDDDDTIASMFEVPAAVMDKAYTLVASMT